MNIASFFPTETESQKNYKLYLAHNKLLTSINNTDNSYTLSNMQYINSALYIIDNKTYKKAIDRLISLITAPSNSLSSESHFISLRLKHLFFRKSLARQQFFENKYHCQNILASKSYYELQEIINSIFPHQYITPLSYMQTPDGDIEQKPFYTLQNGILVLSLLTGFTRPNTNINDLSYISYLSTVKKNLNKIIDGAYMSNKKRLKEYFGVLQEHNKSEIKKSFENKLYLFLPDELKKCILCLQSSIISNNANYIQIEQYNSLVTFLIDKLCMSFFHFPITYQKACSFTITLCKQLQEKIFNPKQQKKSGDYAETIVEGNSVTDSIDYLLSTAFEIDLLSDKSYYNYFSHLISTIMDIYISLLIDNENCFINNSHNTDCLS